MMILVMLFLSVFLATLPSIALILFIWWLDRYEREPLWLLGGVFAWGGMGGIFLGIVISLVFTTPITLLFGPQAASVAGAMFVAPLVEEMTKGAILVLLVFNRNFDNATDGFVYGSATGLGFGMVENLLYFGTGALGGDVGAWFGMVFLRTLFTAPMHGIASSCFGATLGYAKFQRSPVAWVFLPVAGLGAGMTVHFLWNTLAVLSESLKSGAPLLFSILVITTELAAVFILFQISLMGESKVIRRELGEEAAGGLIPRAHVAILPSYLRRMGGGWLPPHVHKRRYVARATELAFRRNELASCSPGKRPFYEKEVARLRAEVAALLAPPAPPVPPAMPPGGYPYQNPYPPAGWRRR